MYSGAFTPGKLVLVVPLVLHNPAPAPLIVTDLRLRVETLTDTNSGAVQPEPQIKLRWIATHTAVYPKNETRSYAAPFVVDGREAVERFVEFQRDDPPSLLEAGPYRAVVEAVIEPKHWWSRRRWQEILSYTFNAQLAKNGRTSLIPRSNDPDLWGDGESVWA